MKNKISFFVLSAFLVFVLVSFKMPVTPKEDAFTCPLAFEIASTTTSGCTVYYPTGANYTNFNWVGWEVTYAAGGTNLFKTDASVGYVTQSFGSSGCAEGAVTSVRAKAMRVCEGVAHLSDWVYYGVE